MRYEAELRNEENEENEIIIITAYYPDKDKWSDDYKRRIENNSLDK